jgi:hypothetical protein
VISTREPLDWPREARVPLVQRIDVEKLPEDDSRELLRSGLGGLPAETEAQLLAASWRIPLLLQAMVNAYAVRAGENGDVDFDVDPASPEDTLTHLLDHLSSERRRVAVALAAVQIFDQGMYDYLIRELHLQVSDEDFPEIASSLFIEDLPSGLYKTHDLLTDAARRSPSDRALRSAALKAATVYLFTQCAGGGLGEPDKVLPLFGALLAGWCSIDTMPVRSAEVFVDAAYVLYDSGHWRELVSMVPAAAAELPRHHAVAVIAELFAALATRRTVGVDSALTRLDQLRGRSDVLGDHARSVDVELAYLRELSGDYAGVRPEFRSLSRAATPFEPTNRNHLRSRLYHADMLIMDGEFREGSRLLLETYEEIGRRAPLDWAELVRCRARAHYCSFELERAAELLREAMEASSRAPAMLAKLQTNLAEVHSWHEPDRALAEADLAVELNAQLGSKIELAKCDAAKGIALARMGESGAAEDAVERAAAQARAVGYPAGVAFALQARATARALAADHEGFAVAYAELSQALEALGTYGHLRVGPAWLSGDDLRFVESAVDVDWIDPDELEDRLHRYFSA